MFKYARRSRLALNSRLLEHFHTSPNPQCYSPPPENLLPLCASAQSLNQTKQAHAICILRGHLPFSVSLSAALILRYTAFQASPSTLYALFHQTLAHHPSSTFLYNTLIRAHATLSLYNEGLTIYNKMVRNGVRPDDYTYPFVLKLCSECLAVWKGAEAHGVVVKIGFDKDVFVNNTLMLLYGNCGDLEGVEKVFDEMNDRDVVSWNTIIRIFSDNGFGLEVMDLFKEMDGEDGVKPNAVSVVTVLPVCSGNGDSITARGVHCYVVKVGLDCQVSVGNALIDVYGKCGKVESAIRVFNEMAEKNDVSWNALITSFAYCGCHGDALNSLRLMVDEGMSLNSVTLSSVLPVLVELGFFGKGREVHGFSVRMRLDIDIFVANSLIDMYGKSGCPNEASNVFCMMNIRNIVSWNTMVANFAQNGRELEAIDFVRQMQAHGETPNSVTFTNVLPACARISLLRVGKEIHTRLIRTGLAFELFVLNSLMDMYVKCGCLGLAWNVFTNSPKDEVSYNILIVGYSQTNECSNSLVLFSEMGLLGMNYDTVSFMGVLSACANISAVKQGKEIHAFAIRRSFDAHLFVANSLLDMYMKSGRIDLARKVFDRISKKDSASWNTMILGYGMLGELDTAINLFEAMREDGVNYDSVSYIAVLSACSHGGLVEKGRRYFDDMVGRGIKPSQMHYACMVDLLGRSGLIEEALELLKSLPVEPDANIFGALLGACRLHGNVELGCWAAEHLLRLQPDHSGYYILLSNMYAEADKWEEADSVRELMKLRGVKKNPGYSWLQNQDQICTFLAGDSLDSLDGGSIYVV